MKLTGDGPASSESLDATFAALSDATRRAILAHLAAGPATVAQLAEPFAMTQPAISKHLKVLEAAGLIVRDRDAQRRPSRLEAAPLAEAGAWLADYRVSEKTPSGKPVDSVDELRQKKKKGKKNKHKKH